MTSPAVTTPLSVALERSTDRLINCRVEGVWRGELSSSALSTATAIIALILVDREDRQPENAPRIRAGLEWLLKHQNPDGGWGDTLKSVSNISTTALCWAAIGIVGGGREECRRAEIAASGWLTEAAGGHGVASLVSAITARYGKDHTFSVPILTVLALAGKIGPDLSGWRRVPQLPFELAACPHQWFRWLKLPVVSYALPALIAIGQVRHHHVPSPSFAVRSVRNATRARTLRVLESIQPTSGGFLEATPLTSFVTMSLAASGNARHPVAQAGIEFLHQSARPDGSWPIDTDLATWVTTLAINALSESPEFARALPVQQRRHLRDWLLGQQYRTEHPYTHAAPGGWAWTELPGGVPDADDTPGALLALHHLDLVDDAVIQAAEAGVTWLLDLQNGDGGMPTFCKGWGTLPFDRSGADLTAHALLAWHVWRPKLPEPLRRRVERASSAASSYLRVQQRPDGSWIPLWFGNQDAPGDDNPTYGTSRVLLALHALDDTSDLRSMRARGSGWLLAAQNPDGGWGGDRGVPSSIEETALAVHALAADRAPTAEVTAAVERGVAWLIEHTRGGTEFPPSPIGFYFAKLWYFEELYPLIFTVGALGRVASRTG
jgi:squalene-hopene/tetraprenyl-beta-curcumene cyclase